MADIQTYLDYILSKVYGKDVRQSIVDAINQCYLDATAGITPVITTEEIAGGTKFTVTVGSVSTSFNVMNGISPQVASASTVSEMTDTDLIYVYTGSETGYESGDWYYYDGEEWQDGGQYQSTVPAIDSTLTIAGAAADAKATGDAIAAIGGGLTTEAKQALLACFENVAWIGTDGQDYYDALEAALYPPVDLSSISAVYTQSGAVYADDTLDSLKSDLVVTAHYSDSTSGVVTTYTLSGVLAVGTSSITVSYNGKTTTFSVTVSEHTVAVENGAVSLSDGSETESTTRARTDYIPCTNPISFAVDADINTNLMASYMPRYFDSNKQYIRGGAFNDYIRPLTYGITDWCKGDGTEYTDTGTGLENVAYVRFLMRTTAGSETITNVSGSITVCGVEYTIVYS